jgi:hypothetical protein
MNSSQNGLFSSFKVGSLVRWDGLEQSKHITKNGLEMEEGAIPLPNA